MPRGRKPGSWKDLYEIKEVKDEKGKKGYMVLEKITGRVRSQGILPTKKVATEVAKMFLRVQKEGLKAGMEIKAKETKRPRGRPRKIKE